MFGRRVGALRCGLALALGSAFATACEEVDVTAGGCACTDASVGPTRVSLECFCAELGCPSYAEALAESSCEGGFGSVARRQGCGLILLSQGSWAENQLYAFDEQTHALVGARYSQDYGFGACGTPRYEAGVFTCDESETCSPCPGAEEPCEP